MGISLEDEVALMAEDASPLAAPAPDQPENGVIDFNVSTIQIARKVYEQGGTAEQIAAATGVALSRCRRFVEVDEPARLKPPEPEAKPAAKKKAAKANKSDGDSD